MPSYDEQVAKRILEALFNQFPKPTTSKILKNSEEHFAEVSQENWLLTLDGLYRSKQIEGEPYITGSNQRFNGIIRLRITQLGKDALASGKRGSPRNERTKNKNQFQGIADTYTVVRLKGQGGSGSVYEVTDSEGQTFALKHLRSNIPTKARKRFLNEIEFCRQHRSKNIIRILDAGPCTDGSLFYVMPYYPETLRDTMRAGIPHTNVLRLFGQILDGVEAAHLLKVCHRDIKPENILVNQEQSELAVADFGVAGLQEEELFTLVETGTSDRLANFMYAAPEQRVRGSEVGVSADVYALGLILNEMFTKRIPEGTGINTISQVAAEYSYIDDLVELMRRQQPTERPSIEAIKNQLISRKEDFLQWQRLNRQNQVVPITESDDPLIARPVKITNIEFDGRCFVATLSQGVNEKWERCFRNRATTYNGNVSAAMMRFQRGYLI